MVVEARRAKLHRDTSCFLEGTPVFHAIVPAPRPARPAPRGPPVCPNGSFRGIVVDNGELFPRRRRPAGPSTTAAPSPSSTASRSMVPSSTCSPRGWVPVSVHPGTANEAVADPVEGEKRHRSRSIDVRGGKEPHSVSIADVDVTFPSNPWHHRLVPRVPWITSPSWSIRARRFFTSSCLPHPFRAA